MNFVIAVLFGLLGPVGFTRALEDNQVRTFIGRANAVIEQKYETLLLPEDVGLETAAYLKKHDYLSEDHEITTDDGYILTLHRIPSAQGQKTTSSGKPAVLFVHGLVSGPTDWISRGPNNSIALLLADAGYDVWLLGTRGTHFSLKHQTLNTSDRDYWQFSFHEKGVYDVASSVDYILAATGLSKISLVAHSEGTSEIMALTSTRTEYNDKLNLLVLLSPVGYMGGVRSPIPLLLMKYMTELQILLDALKFYGISYSDELGHLITGICSIDGFSEICLDFLKLLCGDDKDQVNNETMLIFLSTKPGGLSTKELMHYGQEMKTATFQQYDYGLLGNLERYGTSGPPAYDPTKITAPVAAFYASNDLFAATADVETLLSLLPNKAESHLLPNEDFNHLGYMISDDARSLVYDPAISLIQKYNPLPN